MVNKILEEILKRVRKGESWLLKPTEEYKYQLFQPLKIARKYAGIDEDCYLKLLQQKWKFLGYKESTNPQSKKKLKNIECITMWLHDHPNADLTQRGIINQIKLDTKIPYSTIRTLLRFMEKNDLISIRAKNSLYEKLFASNLKISFSQRKNKK